MESFRIRFTHPTMDVEHELFNCFNKLFFPHLFDPSKLVLVLSKYNYTLLDTKLGSIKESKTHSFSISDNYSGDA